jgi:hypothetical protein
MRDRNTTQFNWVGYVWRGVLDAEAYFEGRVTNRTTRSDIVPGIMKGGWETACA